MNVINQETGEVYELPDEKNEIIEQNKQEIAKLVTDKVLDMYAQYEMCKQQKEMFEHQLLEEMKKRNIIKYEDNYILINYIDEHETTRVDTDKLKEAGLYEMFTKTSKTKESVRIKIKND